MCSGESDNAIPKQKEESMKTKLAEYKGLSAEDVEFLKAFNHAERGGSVKALKKLRPNMSPELQKEMQTEGKRAQRDVMNRKLDCRPLELVPEGERGPSLSDLMADHKASKGKTGGWLAAYSRAEHKFYSCPDLDFDWSVVSFDETTFWSIIETLREYEVAS